MYWNFILRMRARINYFLWSLNFAIELHKKAWNFSNSWKLISTKISAHENFYPEGTLFTYTLYPIHGKPLYSAWKQKRWVWDNTNTMKRRCERSQSFDWIFTPHHNTFYTLGSHIPLSDLAVLLQRTWHRTWLTDAHVLHV